VARQPDTYDTRSPRLAAAQAAVGLGILLLLGWGTLLLARSKQPPPPLPPYELPQAAADEPLPEMPEWASRAAGREGHSRREWPTQVLTFNNGVEPQTLDPALMQGMPEHTIALALFEGLTTLHPKTLVPIPGIAERWDVSPDGRTYVFHLRPSVWSNGEPLTAQDFVYSWRRALDPKTASFYADMLHALKNGEAFNKGTVTDPAEVGVRALDALTLEARLENPLPYFLELTAFGTYSPVHRATVEAHGDRWTRPEHIVSNGPFVLTDWRQNDRVVMKKNPHYWNADRVVLQEIQALAIDDAETALKKFQAGEVDWIRDVPAVKVADLARLPGFRYAPAFACYFYRFNVNRPPLDDRRVRRALALAIDKDAIARYIQRAGQRPARSFVPPVLRDYQAVEGPAYDPAAARRLLAEAGFPDGRGFPSLEIMYNTSDDHKAIAETIQYLWRTHLGVTVDLRNQEWKVYLDSTNRLRYDIARSNWIGDYNDPSTFLDMFITDGGNNRTGWSNARYDECLRLARQEPDHARRTRLFQEAERILVDDEMPIVPLYHAVYTYLVRPGVEGVFDNFRNVHPFQYLYRSAD
jgi:oligopeptide transport system substrate-binding protein